MAGKAQHNWPCKGDLEALLDSAGSLAAAARQLGVSAPGMRHQLARIGIEVPRPAWQRNLTVKAPPTATPVTEVRGDHATVITEARADVDLGDLDKLIRDRGLNPEDWEVKRAKLNEWDALARGGDDPEIVTLKQLTAHLERKTPIHWLFPALDVQQRPAPRAHHDPELPQVIACLPDQHAPYHDPELHERLLGLLAEVVPHKIVNLGDLGDYATISRHRDSAAWNASPQESIAASFSILSDQRATLPDAEIVLLKGNHDVRLETELLARAERMFGLKPADIPGEQQVAAYSLRHLLHLDRLHVRLVEPEVDGDEYFHAEEWLAPGLVAIHGEQTKKVVAARVHAERIGASVVMGHSHRLTISEITRWTPKGRERLLAAEAGTLRSIGKSAGYVSRPDWQQGAIIATVHPGGQHDLEAVRYDGECLHWRGRRY